MAEEELVWLGEEFARFELAASRSAPDARAPLVAMERDMPEHPCRYEALAEASPAFERWARRRIQPLVEEMFAERAFLFKDKVNIKRPGGGVYGPHQDFAAYRHFPPRSYLTAMIALDPMEPANGCLEIAVPGAASDPWPLFPQMESGPGDIDPVVAEKLVWTPLALPAGALFIFDGMLPHRSGPNLTGCSRRAFFLTYNRAAEGDHYQAYYARKRRAPDDPIFHVSTPTARGPVSEAE